MKFIETKISGVLIIEPQVFGDQRGFFMESYNAQAWTQAIGETQFVQDNHSRSGRGVLRGLHYQWVGAELTEENHRQLWVPAGFAHGFLTLTEEVDFLYKTTATYAPSHERAIAWNDPDIGITWPDIGVAPQLSAKDQAAPILRDIDPQNLFA